MIRALTEADRAQLEAFLHADPHYNLYMLGNLASLGVQHKLTEFWGDYAVGEPELLRGVVNRYMRGWSIYGRPEADWQGLVELLDTYPEAPERLQDNPGGIDSVLPFLRRLVPLRVETEELMTLDASHFIPRSPPPGVQLRPANTSDIDSLVQFYADAGPMRRSRQAIEHRLNDSYFWIAEVAGAIRAAALTNAVSSGYAMIGGVYTAPQWRGKGISQALCSTLCTALLTDSLVPTLYWDAPDAGRVYHKLGFKPIGNWRSVWLTPQA